MDKQSSVTIKVVNFRIFLKVNAFYSAGEDTDKMIARKRNSFEIKLRILKAVIRFI